MGLAQMIPLFEYGRTNVTASAMPERHGVGIGGKAARERVLIHLRDTGNVVAIRQQIYFQIFHSLVDHILGIPFPGLPLADRNFWARSSGSHRSAVPGLMINKSADGSGILPG